MSLLEIVTRGKGTLVGSPGERYLVDDGQGRYESRAGSEIHAGDLLAGAGRVLLVRPHGQE